MTWFNHICLIPESWFHLLFKEIQLPSEPTNILPLKADVISYSYADAPSSCYYVDNAVPQIPCEQVFKAIVLHVDKNAVVWIMPEDSDGNKIFCWRKWVGIGWVQLII